MQTLGSLDNIGVAVLKDAIATVCNAAISSPEHNLPCAGAQKFSISGSLAFSPITLHIFMSYVLCHQYLAVS